MRLLVTNEHYDDLPFDTVVMSSAEFNTKSVHMYISSANFDTVIIETNADVNLSYIKYVMSKSKVIPKIVGDITINSVGILCEIYKERAAELRVLFVRDKDRFYSVLDELRTQFHWEEFYTA